MSAFIVSKKHIDLLIRAGLHVQVGPGGYTLSWYTSQTKAEKALSHQRGEPWGPGLAETVKKHRRELTPETADQVGCMLWAENYRSVNHRYDENEIEQAVYAHQENIYAGVPDPLHVLKAINCYEYQSCEHPEWEESEAYAFCDALRRAMIHQLPGYDDAPWETL